MSKASSVEPESSVGASLDDARGRRQTAPLQGKALSLWLWVGAGFLFMALLWTGMILAVRQVDSRTVPLATQEAKP